MLHDSNLECIEYTDELRHIPGSEELIEQMEDFYFGAAAKSLAALRKARGKNNER
jgi:predicted DNA-binding protein